MKRSEAVYQLAGYLSTYHWYEERHPEELVELARVALDGMEKIGMRPPLLLNQKYKGPFEGWEPEDEQQ